MPDRVKLTKRLLDEYSAAFVAANGRDAPHVLYAAGWFRIGSLKYRRSDIEEMCRVLRARAASNAKGD